ncbi:GNAT family N-acetyltransferase [Novosphingobium malaysiense]|uniref:GNAT family acetyltransferase n=1 Tax=Novosphingobium malaysiense TaxID=1348853 RepID=A0A0B1ZPB8_9SPHN|nr:GNAT family N-acetyltransferase [Novosphingobium malaysiense]KHK91094.1 GNAT family acetyltransferase [Novosphingobium malaysiense]
MIPTIETDRLVLRGPQAEDYPVYRDFFADAQASGFYGGPLPADAAWRVLATDIGHWHLRGYGRWALVTKDGNETIGGCGLWWPKGYPRSELTWWVVTAARRRGFALEASRAAVAFGYRELGWPLVETHMSDANHAARGLVEKLGGEVIARERFPDGLCRNVYRLPCPV